MVFIKICWRNLEFVLFYMEVVFGILLLYVLCNKVLIKNFDIEIKY